MLNKTYTPFEIPDEMSDRLTRFYQNNRQRLNQAESLEQLDTIQRYIASREDHNFHKFEGFDQAYGDLMKIYDRQKNNLKATIKPHLVLEEA